MNVPSACSSIQNAGEFFLVSRGSGRGHGQNHFAQDGAVLKGSACAKPGYILEGYK